MDRDVVRGYVDWFAEAVGASPPTDEDIERILELAGLAAHASARQAAPVTCWLAAARGLDPTEAVEIARRRDAPDA